MKNNFWNFIGCVRPLGVLFCLLFLCFVLLLPVNAFSEPLDSEEKAVARKDSPRDERALSFILAMPEDGTAIVVDKEAQTLFLYGALAGKGLEQILSFPCSTGEAAGPKQVQGDKKTPEGIYFLVDEYEDKYLTPVYGIKAFPTDYPHYIDRQRGKNGSAIWIHGTDKPLQPRSSNGCIALDNKNILELSKYIHLNKTPVILTHQMGFSSARKIAGQRKKAETLISSWLLALQSGSYHDYLACYAPSYLPDMFWWQQWQNFREWAGEKKQEFSLAAEHRGIYSHQDLVVAVMDMKLNTPAGSVLLGTRKLFLQEREEDGGMAIVGDEYQSKPDCFAGESFPLVAAANGYRGKQGAAREVMDTVRSWLLAWSSKDMNAYGSFYAPGFKGDGLSRREWLNRKRDLARRYQTIQVTGEKFTLNRDHHIMVVRFFQKYRATGFSTDGFKELKLVRIGGSWKIFQEIWKGK